MTKYYVESGPEFRFTLLADNPVHAVLKALAATDGMGPLRLADVFIVNQRGFVWDRPGRRLQGDEKVFPTRRILRQPHLG